MRKRVTKQYPSRPLSERIDDWVISVSVVMLGVSVIMVAYLLGVMSVVRVAAR